MTLDQLRYVLELQRTRHFSKAAENCFITQPSLSIQVAKLEEELGTPLFNRTRAGVEMTEYGEELLKQARLIVDEAARLGQMAKELRGEVQGVFRLGIIPTLAPSLLPLFVADFGRKYPGVELTITEESTQRLVTSIDEGAIDGAILSTPARCPETLVEKVLFYEPFLLFASEGHAMLERKRVAIDQLSSTEMLLLDDTHCLRDQVLQLCKMRQKSGAPRLRIQSASLQTLIEFIRKNEGYTLLPALSSELLTPRERTANVRSFDKPLPSRKVSLVFHQNRLKRSVTEALKETILASLPDRLDLPTTKGELRVLSPGVDHFEI